jgi:hypothetical protein
MKRDAGGFTLGPASDPLFFSFLQGAVMSSITTCCARLALSMSALALAAGCAISPPVPPAIAAAADEAPAMTLAARGVQVYECRAAADGATAAWTLVEPDAELFDTGGRHIGHHGAGPHWQAADGSRIDGRVKARSEAPVAGAIPWLLLAAQPSGPRGSFSGVTSVQRINTVGGVAPADGCTLERRGATVRVDYRADYRLFTARAPSPTPSLSSTTRAPYAY